MSENKVLNFKNVFLGAVQIATLFVPAFFLNDLLSFKVDGVVSLFLIPIFLGLCSLVAVFGTSIIESVSKWLLSIPISVIYWLYLVNTKFSVRSLNWVFPEYGESSAGGNFAHFLLLAASTIIDLIFILIGIVTSKIIKSEKYKKHIFILQKIVCTVICVSIVITIFILNIIMPGYSGYTNG